MIKHPFSSALVLNKVIVVDARCELMSDATLQYSQRYSRHAIEWKLNNYKRLSKISKQSKGKRFGHYFNL